MVVEGERTRLESWKAIATYFGRGERTVRRWEAELGLPVRRMPGAAKGRVYAFKDELEGWRSGHSKDVQSPDPETLPSEEETGQAIPLPEHGTPSDPPGVIDLAASPAARLTKRAPGWTAATLVLLLSLSTAWWLQSRAAQPGPESTRSPRVKALDARGEVAWAKRTPASLSAAADDFSSAVKLDPRDARGWLGLAKTYDLMPEYTLMPAAQAYGLARESAGRALALDDRLSEAHAAFAFASFWGYWDAATAAREFRRALSLNGRSALAHHWYATFLNTMANRPAALKEINAALKLDPASEPILADKGMILLCSGRMAEAIPLLTALEARDPGFLSPHAYLAQADLASGQDPEYLREAAIVVRLSGGDSSEIVRPVREAYEREGHAGILRTLLSEALARYRSGNGSALEVANAYARLGDADASLPWLSRALDRHESGLVTILGNDDYQNVRSTPAFEAVRAHLRT